MTMIEHVAWAIEREDVGNLGADVQADRYAVMARAAIAAMREPMPEMSKAGWVIGQDHNRVWQAMIDKALEEK